MKIKLLWVLSIFCCCNGCSFNNGPEINLSVVDAEKNQLFKQWESYSYQERQQQFQFFKLMKREYGYTQPDNKKVACKIPTIRHPAFKDVEHKVYWDGNCKNGYGVDLGRIIIKGVYDHAELIIDLPQSGFIPLEYLYWYRNYTENLTEYGIDLTTGESNVAREKINKTPFFINSSLEASTGDGVYQFEKYIDANGLFFSINYLNPLFGYRQIINEDPTYPIAYELKTTNHQTRKIMGVSKAVLKNGTVLTYLPSGTNVSVPRWYFNIMETKLERVPNYVSSASNYVEKAGKLYEIYVQKSCNNTNSTNGIESNLFHKICSYGAQFNDDIAQVLQKIELAQEHRQKLAQINAASERENERRMAANTQKAFDDFNKTIQGISDNLNRNTETIMQQNQKMLENWKFYHNLKCLTQPFCTMMP